MGDFRGEPGQCLDRPVPTDEPVVVVVSLEVVEVGIEQGEGDVLSDAPPDLLLDADVPRQTRERRERPHLAGPAKRSLDPGQQLNWVERLDDVVVGSRRQAEHLVRGQCLRRQHDDAGRRRSGVAPEPLRNLEAVELRHHDVEEDEIRAELNGPLQRLLAVRCNRDLVAGRAQVHLDEPCDVRVVVHHQDHLGHVATP